MAKKKKVGEFTGKVDVYKDNKLEETRIYDKGVRTSGGSSSSSRATPSIASEAITTAPEVRPKQTKKQVSFNDDGTTTLNVGGQEFKLSEQEYKDYLNMERGKGGRVTPNIQAYREALQTERAKVAKTNELLAEGQDIRLTNEILEEEAQRQGLEDVQKIPTIEELRLQEQIKQDNVERLAKLDPDRHGLIIPEQLIFSPEARRKYFKRTKQNTKTAISTLAEVADAARVSLFGGETTKQKKAEASVDETLEVISDEIEAVRLGGDPTKALETLRVSADALNRLEASQKSLGKINANYWIDEGAQVEEKIIVAQREINAKINELNEAAQEARERRIREQFGA